MPIEPVVFARHMSLLAERFGRPVSKPVSAAYYQFLSRTLTTEEFICAANSIFAESTFWPSPMEFIDRARGSVEDQAQLEWMAIIAAVADNRPLPAISVAARSALKSVGDTWAVATSSDTPRLHRDFIAACTTILREERRRLTLLPALEETNHA